MVKGGLSILVKVTITKLLNDIFEDWKKEQRKEVLSLEMLQAIKKAIKK